MNSQNLGDNLVFLSRIAQSILISHPKLYIWYHFKLKLKAVFVLRSCISVTIYITEVTNLTLIRLFSIPVTDTGRILQKQLFSVTYL